MESHRIGSDTKPSSMKGACMVKVCIVCVYPVICNMLADFYQEKSMPKNKIEGREGKALPECR